MTVLGFQSSTNKWQTFLPYLNVKDYGAVGDGVANDTAACRAAIAEGMATRSTVYFPKGTYSISSSLTDAVPNAHVKLRGEGEDSIIYSYVENAPLFNNLGTLVGASTLSSPAAMGDRTLVMASTSGYAANMDVEIRDTSQKIIDWDVGAEITNLGEMNRIRAVTDSTHLLLWSQIEASYNAGTMVNPMGSTSSDWDIRDLAFHHTAGAAIDGNQRGININRIRRVFLDNLVFRGYDGACIRLGFVLDAMLTNIRGEGLNASDPARNLNPYLVAVGEGCNNILCERLYLRQGRHCFTTLSSATYIEPAHVLISDSTAYECMAGGFDIHPGARQMTIDNCQVWGADFTTIPGLPAPGYQLRGRQNILQNSRASGVVKGAQISDAEDCSIINCDFTACNNGVTILNSPGALVRGVTIRDPIESGVRSEWQNGMDIRDVTVSDIRVLGNPSGAAIDFSEYWHDSFLIEKIHAPDATVKLLGVPFGHYYRGTPDAVKFESLPRNVGVAAIAPLTSGTLFLTAIQLEAGERISEIGFIAAAATVGQTHLWAVLYDQNRQMVAITADALTAAPVAGAHTKLALTAPFMTVRRGLYYIGLMQAAGTPMTMYGCTTNSALTALSPAQAGNSTAGLTTPTGLWTPLNLGASLKAWWNADDTVNGAVATWTDRVGSMAVTAAAGFQPVSAAASFNGAFRGLAFDGVDDCLASTSLGTIPTGPTGGEIFSVLSQAEAAGAFRYAVVYGGTAGANSRSVGKLFSVSLKMSITDGATTLSDNHTFSGPHIVSGSWSGTTEAGRFDGSNTNPASATIAALNTDTTRLRIGAANNTAADFWWLGTIRHILITTSLLASDRERMEGWAAWNNGLVGNLPSLHPYKSAAPLAVGSAAAITASGQLPYFSIG